MKKSFLILIAALLAVAFQTSFLTNFFPAGEVPNILLIVLIIMVSYRGFERMWKAVILAGLMADLIFFTPVGMNILAFMIVAFGTSSLAKRFFVTHRFSRYLILLILVAGGTFVYNLAILFLFKAYYLSHQIIAGPVLVSWRALFLQTGFSILLFIIFYWPIKKLERATNTSYQKPIRL